MDFLDAMGSKGGEFLPDGTLVIRYQSGMYRDTLQCPWHASLLHEAVNECNLEKIKELVDCGEAINATDFFRRTVLHHAITNMHVMKDKDLRWEVVHQLVTLGADVNAEDELCITPLQLAVQTFYQTPQDLQQWCVNTLVRNGANPWLRCKDGHNAIDIALQERNDYIFPALLYGVLFSRDSAPQLRFESAIEAICCAIRCSNFHCLAIAMGYMASISGQYDYTTLSGIPLISYALMHGSSDDIIHYLSQIKGVPPALRGTCGIATNATRIMTCLCAARAALRRTPRE